MEAARPATPTDVPALAALAERAIAELAPTRGGAVFVAREGRAEPLASTLGADVEDPSVCVLVGTIDATPVGYAVGRSEVLRDGSTLGVITDLYVEAGGRSVGVGEAMMGSLLDFFREAGCAGVDATALPGNRATKNFFEESGFTARLLVMHHRLV
ncbi:MAG TPA: GNAT family N-acetyltransferase [Acidimicrobiales bacterium]|nr:GNAT family N-acetyltransferase [Acidimicrobiales bacterium]